MRKLLVILFLPGLVLLFAVPVLAQDGPVATAQAADRRADEQQRRANQAAASAGAARATAAAAWEQATATAGWVATATPAAATAQAQATRQALQVEGTRQAIYAQATATAQGQAVAATAMAQALQATAAKSAAMAEQDRLFVELDRLALERSRALHPLYTWGPWVMVGLFIALAVWVARQLASLLKTRLRVEPQGIAFIEGEFDAVQEEARAEPVCRRQALLAPTVERGCARLCLSVKDKTVRGRYETR